jgi:hypothetical protein
MGDLDGINERPLSVNRRRSKCRQTAHEASSVHVTRQRSASGTLVTRTINDRQVAEQVGSHVSAEWNFGNLEPDRLRHLAPWRWAFNERTDIDLIGRINGRCPAPAT